MEPTAAITASVVRSRVTARRTIATDPSRCSRFSADVKSTPSASASSVATRTASDDGPCSGNVIWFVLGGIWLALGHLIAGPLLVPDGHRHPLGIASFKMAALALAPFGERIVPVGTVPSTTPGAVQPPPSLGL